MINRTKLEHILEYARKQRRFGQLCKILPGDMVEIVEIAMRKTGNSPVTPDGWISCSESMPEMGERQCYVLAADFKNNYPPNIPNTQVGVYGDWFNDGNPTWDDGDGEDLYLKEVTHWMPLPEPPRLKEL
ncbi:TPA: DUF551 domain-containing protein [Escherichia albertii]|uniref:DUF551 domain-containing protein n=1 Tax=Escherichia albertii TaxID=208962 RepID=UPI00195CFE2C|nr:DUF551 domain-containing protein [Escherichia albertii]QST45886.1 DUF551 domain-containing protein [Escherichia albertii]HEB1255834.1 DUF551 domain-containing protein [Escherichia albertii]